MVVLVFAMVSLKTDSYVHIIKRWINWWAYIDLRNGIG